MSMGRQILIAGSIHDAWSATRLILGKLVDRNRDSTLTRSGSFSAFLVSGAMGLGLSTSDRTRVRPKHLRPLVGARLTPPLRLRRCRRSDLTAIGRWTSVRSATAGSART